MNNKQHKLSILVIFSIFSTLSFSTPGITADGIVGSKHDFSQIDNPNFPKDSQGRICVYCHAAHNATKTPTSGPSLWNGPISSEYFTMYGTTSGGSVTNGDGYLNYIMSDGPIGGPTGPSALCMSCHDGETLLFGSTITVQDLNPDSNIGTDLTNDHPISFTFQNGKAGIPDDMVEIIPGLAVLGDFLYAGRFECTACHDVHNSAYDLAPPTDICTRCHVDNFAPQLGLASRAPHNSNNNIQCMDCHSPHNVNNIPAPHPPLLNIHCTSCHTNNTGSNYSTYSAPYVETHQVQCWDCHQNHLARPSEQPLVKGYYLSAAYDQATDTTTLTLDDSVQINDQTWNNPVTWSAKTGTERGLLLWIHYTDATDSAFEIETADNDTITFKGQISGASDNTFALTYGQSIRTVINGNTVHFTGPASLANNDGLAPNGNDSTPDGICQVCHTTTRNWKADGSGADHYKGSSCFECHTHQTGFLPANTSNCSDCHQDYASGQNVSIVHEVHLNALHGPQLNMHTPAEEQVCIQCHFSHDSGTADPQAAFPRAIPNACNNCHSPGGAYDGVSDPQLGALNNLDGMESAIYDTEGLLKPGKEEWCLTCHDDGASSIHGVTAPNIAGKTVTGAWQSPTGFISSGFESAATLIDGDTNTGNSAGETDDLIFDLGSTRDITHIRIYNNGPSKSLFEVYGSNDLQNWKRILYGRRVEAAIPYWKVAGRGWFETRLDDFAPTRYVKLVRISQWPLEDRGLREFEYKADLSYGYMVSGHKMSCDYCHDTTSIHTDSLSRTYSAVDNNYSTGYRLSDVLAGADAVPALEIPRTECNDEENTKAGNDFALCFSCHDKGSLLGDAYGTGDFLKKPLQTFFRNDTKIDANGNPTNAHLYHLKGKGPCGNSQSWDSDWDGIPDSPQSCTACHNVHGSPNPAMTRHGELASTPGTTDKVPMINFAYLDANGVVDTNLMDRSASTGSETQFYSGGPGTVEKNFTCKMCHSDKVATSRTP